jgi:hypothetical protein
MTHEEFKACCERGAIEVRVDQSLAIQVMNSHLLPLRYRASWVFWTWVWLLLLPSSVALAILYRWWLAPIGLYLAWAVLRGAKQSAFEFVLEHARANATFYDAMNLKGLFHISAVNGGTGPALAEVSKPSVAPSAGAGRSHERGRCEQCGVEFEFWLFGCHYANCAYAYCSDCGATAILERYADAWPKRVPLQAVGALGGELEDYLAPCSCGGRFSGSVAPRCPSCNTPLDPVQATSYLEARTEPGRRGWWAKSWHNKQSGIVINGMSELNPWLDSGLA